MSFRLKTILGIALIEVCLLAVLVISGLYYLRHSSEAELLKRGQVTAQLISTMTGDAVVSMDLATLDTLINHTIQNYGIVYIRVRSEDGTILSQGGELSSLESVFKADASVSEAQSDGRLDVAAPIMVAGQIFGHVEIGLSISQLEQTIAEAQNWMLSIAGSEILLVAVFGMLLGTILTRQLKSLQLGALRVAEGEFGYRLSVSGKDELADTAASFNSMSQALAEFAAQAEAARKRAEAGRAYAETVLHDALNSMPEAVLVLDKNLNTSFINESFLNRYSQMLGDLNTGCAFDEIAEVTLANEIEVAEQWAEFTVDERMLRLKKAEVYPHWRSVLADGCVMLTTQQRMSDGGVVIVEHDITDLYKANERNRALELELMQTHKMEALGTLASGIAHEINTPLQFIGDNIRFLSESFDEIAPVLKGILDDKSGQYGDLRQKLENADWEFIEEEAPEAFIEANKGVKTVKTIVQSIKEFAHPEKGEKSYQDMSKLVENVLTVSRNQWSEHADIRIEMDKTLTQVPCFPGKISQVLINLILNAAEAIGEQELQEKGQICIAGNASNGMATITVSDNGPGIEQGDLDKVFEMFFTTKAPGSGTGQGLALSKAIIENTHGGRMYVSSEFGKGATFTIELPLQ